MNRKNISAEYLDAADYTDTKALPQWALDDLAASGLDQDSIRLMQCFPVLDSNHLKELLGFSNMDGQDIMQAVGDAYAIPYWENEAEEDGELPTRSFVRVKLQKPFVRTNGNEVKYLSPLASKECPFHAYFMPGEQAKFKKRKGGIVIVEGEKKAAKVAQDLRKKGDKTTIVIGFPGVTAWYDWAGWNILKISGKQVWICFDAQDYGTNNDSPYQNATHENCMVEDQAMKLWLFLMYEKKARDVKIITWDETDQFKGIDDYLAANPDEIEELLDTASSPFEALPRFGAANGWQQFAEIIASLFMDKKTYTAIYESNNLQKRYGLSTKTWQQKMAAAIAKSHNTADKETTKQEEQTKEQTAPPEHTINWIDDKGRIITGLAAEAFIVSTKGNLIYVKENFYEFAGHVWKIIDDRVIANRIRDMVGTSKAKQTTINDILYQVTINLLERCANVAFNTHRNKLCFTNCVLDIDTMKVEEHNRTYLQTILFPYEYKSIDITDNRNFDEDMDFYAPNWTNFLNDLNFTPATIQRLQEWFGYMLVPTTKLERCLFLKGEGSNGKSTLLETLIAILGNEQVTSLEPQELFDKFKVCMIQDKLANICSDIETSQVFDARFKKLVSGEDQIGEEKQKRPFKFRPYARFIFSANDFIPTRDRSHAFFRRIDIIDFKRIFTEAEQDKDLKDKIKKEIPYIINWALKGLASLRKNNWRFTESQEFAETKAEFESAVNPVKQFVDEEIQVLTPKEIAEYEETPNIACDSFREKYTTWCKSHGYEVMAENKLGRELKRLGIEKKQIRDKNNPKKRSNVYLNIQII